MSGEKRRSEKVLVTDDEPGMRSLLLKVLNREGYAAEAVPGGEEALRRLGEEEWNLLVADIDMPGMDGIALLREVRSRHPSLPVVMITAYATVESAVEAMKLGAADYLTKPFQMEEFRLVVDRVLEHRRLLAEKEMLLAEVRGRHDTARPVGGSAAMREVLELARSVAPSNASVLVEGESGTGKELVARLIHEQSPRRDRPFVVVNCGALAEGVLESELFGHEKGAFSGAVAARKGRFEMADGGTLFIDEVGELPLSSQVKLLRFLQEHEFERVGGARTLRTDVRIVAATNRDLKRMVKEGRFREDLYYRLNVVHIRVPPLRERREDILPLVEHFLDRFSRELGKRMAPPGPEAAAVLRAHPWEGNVRELMNVMERAVVLGKGERVVLADLPEEVRGAPGAPRRQEPGGEAPLPQGPLTEVLHALERRLLRESLARNGGSQTAAAAELGIRRTTLRYKMGKYGLL